ncbi:hypothetical protein L7F22_036873 [Adiantum nelumboides]|nr:hypothetical protein [Adiantum nelumboides]
MGEESLKEEILQLFRGLGTSLLSRVSHFTTALSDLMHSKSIGALAGFAIALVCTWKYMKAAENRRKRLEKRDEAHESATTSSSTGTSTSVALYQTQSGQRGAKSTATEIPVELTTAQIVKRQLNGGRKMTCQLLGVIFQETSPEELQKHAVVRPEVVDILLELAQACDLYLMARLLDDESEANALAALEAVGLFSVGGLNRNKTKDKIFEADKYVQNTDEAYRKIKLALEKTQSKQKKAADRHRRELVFSLGDWELLRFEKARLRKMKGKERLFPKLGMRYYGPFQVCDKISDVAYRLKLPEDWKIHNAFHVSFLRPFVGDVPEDMVPEEQPEVEELDEILVPEQMLAHKDRKVKGKVARRYLVKFENHSPMDAKWIEEAELVDLPQLLQLYLEAFQLQPIVT